jgi:hypothetical protein
MADARVTGLADVLFDVELRPLMVNTGKALFENACLRKVPNYLAVIDVDRENVLCVVSKEYELVKNERAIEMGKQVFGRVFGAEAIKGMEVFHVNVPKTRSFCHIDYWHKDDMFEPWQNEKWVPFLRVTNSYNRTRLLRFDLGFCRWVCTNGVIFGHRGATIKSSHSKNAVREVERVGSKAGDLQKLKLQFIERLNNLQRYHVPKKEMLPLACKVFDIAVDDKTFGRPQRIEQLKHFRTGLQDLTTKYFNEMGENAYAALNVITDFASRPKSIYISPIVVVDSLQKKAGVWIDNFIPAIKNDKFNFAEYLGDFQKSANVILSLN